MKLSYPAALLFLFLSHLSQAQYTETINSNRPGSSQGAFSVGTGVIQLEAGGKIGKDRHDLRDSETTNWGVDYAARLGFWKEQLEISFIGSFRSQNTQYTVGGSSRNYTIQNLESNTLGAKFLLFDPHKNAEEEKPNLYSWNANRRFDWSQLIPAVSVYAGVNITMEDNPYRYEGEGMFTPKVAIITQNNFEGGWVLVFNIIGDKIGQEFPSYAGIATLTHSFSPKFAAFGEIQTIISDIYSDEIFRGGFAYLVNKNFQLDTSGLLNFKNTPARWQATFGISYRFDMHQQDEYLIPAN